MGNEREAMTLEQVRDELRKIADACPAAATKIDVALRLRRMEHMQAKLRVIADSIDAHLSRAAEPVAWIDLRDLAELDSEKYGDYAVHMPIVGPKHKTAFEAKYGPMRFSVPLYTNTPEPARDAKDAARYRWLRDHGVPELCIAVDGLPSYIDHRYAVDQIADAAMAQESDDGK